MTDITLNPEASPTWEKTPATSATKSNKSWQFMVGFALIMGAVAFLILGNTLGGAQYFTYIGKTIRISGAVVGETIQYDTNTLDISFTIAHIPESADNVGEALFIAANDTNAVRLQVFVANTVKPDLLRHEAQAILTGYLGDDGVFYANELLLKCPSRFEDGANPLSVTH